MKKHLIVSFVLALSASFVIGLTACGGTDTTTTAAPPATAAAPPATVAAPAASAAPVAAPAPAAAGGDACARAEECCRAFVTAMGPAGASAAAGCDGMHASIGVAAAAPGCTAAIDGWRQSLTAMSHPVPASCQ